MTESTIHNLEIKVAFLEDALAKLSDEYFVQQRELENLKLKVGALADKLEALQAAGDSDSQILDERPPHY